MDLSKTKVRIERRSDTSKKNWLSIQEQCGLMPSTHRDFFNLYCDPIDEGIWRLECQDHKVRFIIISIGT